MKIPKPTFLPYIVGGGVVGGLSSPGMLGDAAIHPQYTPHHYTTDPATGLRYVHDGSNGPKTYLIRCRQDEQRYAQATGDTSAPAEARAAGLGER